MTCEEGLRQRVERRAKDGWIVDEECPPGSMPGSRSGSVSPLSGSRKSLGSRGRSKSQSKERLLPVEGATEE